MKLVFKLLPLITIVVISAASCKKNKKQAPVGPLGANYPYSLNSIVTPAIIDTLQEHGMAIHDGLNPATINGIYLVSKNDCTFDDSGYNEVGDNFTDVEFQFTGQDNSKNTISEDYKSVGGDEEGSDANATFISGKGNLFTVFAQEKGSSQGISITALYVISGTFDPNVGIKGLQWAYYLQDKGADPNNVLVPVHTTRVFHDLDGESDILNTFALDPKRVNAIPTTGLHQAFGIFKAKK